MNFHIKGSTLASIHYTGAFCGALQNQLYLAALWFYPSTSWVLCYGWKSSHARGILIIQRCVVTPLAYNRRSAPAGALALAKKHGLGPDSEAMQYILYRLGLSFYAQLSDDLAGARGLPIVVPHGSQLEIPDLGG